MKNILNRPKEAYSSMILFKVLAKQMRSALEETYKNKIKYLL